MVKEPSSLKIGFDFVKRGVGGGRLFKKICPKGGAQIRGFTVRQLYFEINFT